MQVGGPIDPSVFPEFLASTRLKLTHCLAPGTKCANPAIAAHSVQKSRFLRLIAEAGHLTTIGQNPSPEALTAEYQQVGINRATTFTGLCGHHDNSMFAPIEKNEVDFDNPEHLFLLAYRSTLGELHEQMESAVRVQDGYIKRVERGWDDPEVPSPEQMQATYRMMLAYEAFEYKKILDEAFLSGDHQVLAHNVVRVHTDIATVAGSALYSVDDVTFDDSWLRMHMNVLPLSDHETVAVFSYLNRAGRLARRHLRPVLTKRVGEIPHNLSQFLLDGCGKLMLRPSYVDSWSQEKKDAALEYFMRTVWAPDLSARSPHFDLFVACA